MVTHANRHPMQLLTPPENVQLRERNVKTQHPIVISRVTVQVPVHPNGRFDLSAHFEPPFRSELVSVWTPHILIPAMKSITRYLYREAGGEMAKETHMLYPMVETETEAPFGMGNSVYTLPEIPTIGFVRGRTSSSTGARTISIAIGLFLKISCARTE